MVIIPVSYTHLMCIRDRSDAASYGKALFFQIYVLPCQTAGFSNTKPGIIGYLDWQAEERQFTARDGQAVRVHHEVGERLDLVHVLDVYGRSSTQIVVRHGTVRGLGEDVYKRQSSAFSTTRTPSAAWRRTWKN